MSDFTLTINPPAQITSTIAVQQGPAGPAGSLLTRSSVQALGGHRAVIAVGATGADYADASDVTHFGRVIGITTGAAALGDPCYIKFSDIIDEPSWTWTPDGDVWVGDNGLLTQTVPSGAFLQRIGFALSATRLWVELSEPLLLS